MKKLHNKNFIFKGNSKSGPLEKSDEEPNFDMFSVIKSCIRNCEQLVSRRTPTNGSGSATFAGLPIP